MQRKNKKEKAYKELTYSIIDLFEDLLEEKGIEIPCKDPLEESERKADDFASNIYGSEYYDLQDKIYNMIKSTTSIKPVIFRSKS
jgi:hypothetical protein